MSLQLSNRNAAESGLHRFEKNRYFHGKLMTARDMEAEQVYHANRLHTLGRHVLGEGHVCGLETTVEEIDGQLEATVTSGLALDSRGRPVVVTGNGPIAVKDAVTGESTLPEGREIHLFLEYDECSRESVPVPGSENSCEEECCYNRILEIFEVAYTEEPPEDYKTVPHVAFPEKDDVDTDEERPAPDDPVLGEIARSYYDDNRAECASDDSSVFLGSYRREEEDTASWERDADPDRRPFVYTNDMLYAAIARHVTDFDDPHGSEAIASIEGVSNPGGNIDLASPEGTLSIVGNDEENSVDLDVSDDIAQHVTDLDNPHEVSAEHIGAIASVEDVSNPGGNIDLDSPDGTVSITGDPENNRIAFDMADDVRVPEDLVERVERLEEQHTQDIETLEGRLHRLERYVMERSLWNKCRTFSDIVETFSTIDDFDDGIAEAIVNRAKDAIDNEIYADEDEYVAWFTREDDDGIAGVSELEAQMIEVFGRLDDREDVVVIGIERYTNALDLLGTALDEEDACEVAVAQDRLCEAAGCLDVNRQPEIE